ncbi:hypothetical protein [Herbidospora sp. RD11066]
MIEDLAKAVVDGALRLWAGGDFEAFVRDDGGEDPAPFTERLVEQVARRIAAFLPEDLAHSPVIARVEESLRAQDAGSPPDPFFVALRDECRGYLVQTARSLPLPRPGVAVRLLQQRNTIAERQNDLATLLFGALPLDVRGVLMRCALPTRFDEDLYDAALRGDGPPLAEMVATGRITRLPGSRRYRLDPALRETAWARWWIDEAYTAVYGVPDAMRRTAGLISAEVHDELERLRLLVLADPGRAVATFWILYERADARFDLVGCRDLLDVLTADDLIGLSPEVAGTRAAYQARLAARTAHATEYRQTGRYLRRDDLERALTGDAKVVHLHGPGGMGKTMVLRWLTARWGVTQWPHLPCARIDLDAIDPVNAVRHPWLVLLEIAAQLSPQVRGEPFSDLLRDHDRYRRVLSRTAVPDTALLSEVAAATADGADVTERFFATALPDHVIVFDTLEELVLRPAADPRPFVETLARLSGRVVLAGRYDLRDRLPGFAETFPEATTAEVTPFDDDLAARYLERRGVTRPDLTAAMVRRSGGLPFALAMYGDLAEANPDLTAAEVDEAREPALLYCLERILERIPDDRLRWLLRYAVLPRHLDAEFVAEVLWPHLEAGLRDDKVYDDPAEDARPDRKTKIFLPGPPPPDVAALWEELTTYAGATSWVQATEDGRLVFHENLRDPVRDLLRAQPIFTVLHEAAEAHYTRRGLSAEAVYHAFQHRGRAALSLWRSLITEAWNTGHVDRAGELADDLLIYATDSDVRYAAYIEQSRAAIEAARRDREPGAAGAHWNRAESALAAAALLGEPSAMHRALTAAVLQARDLDEEAQEELDAIDDDSDRDVAVAVDMVRAASRDLRYVEEAYRNADERDDREVAQFVAMRLGLILTVNGGPLDDAVRYLTEAGDVAGLGRLLLQYGQPESALTMVSVPGQAQGPVEIAQGDERDRLLVEAEALITLRRPAAAIRLLTGRIATDHALSAIMMARALGDLMEYDAALDTLTHARRTATLDSVRATLARETARIHLEVAGDLNAAERALSEHAEADPLQVDLALAQGRLEAAHAIAHVLKYEASDPVSRVKAAVAGLQADLPERGLLISLVTDIEELGLLLESLAGLRKCTIPVDLSDIALESWLTARAQMKPGDRAHLDVIAAEVARLAGRADEAGRLLDDAVSWLANPEGVAWLDWIRARNRLGPATSDEQEPLEINGGPDLRGAFLVELARRRMSVDPEWKTSDRLDRAQALIGDRPLYWHGLLWEARAELAGSDRDFLEAAGGVWRELGQTEKADQTARVFEARWPAPEGEIVVVLDDLTPSRTENWVGAHAGFVMGARELPGLTARLAATREAVDVRLTGEAGPGPEPWELLGWDGEAMGRHPRVRCVYRTPRDLLAADPPVLWLRPVHIVQPDPATAARMRGVPGSLKVAEIYRNRDIRVETRSPLASLGEVDPSVLHLAGVMDVSHGVPALTFLGVNDWIDASTLHAAFRRLRFSSPLIVLDILASENRAEHHRQLELRNRFAQDLVRVPYPITVLAIGPAPGLTRSAVVTDVAFSVAAGSTTPDLWQRIQSHAIDSEDDAYAFAATALFSNVRPPDMPRFGPR